jgi:hypothetical protein
LKAESREIEVQKDISIYFSHELERLKASSKIFGRDNRTRQKRLNSGAEGMFLWVSLMIQRLEKASNRMIDNVLRETPKGLDGIYGRILDEIPGNSRAVMPHVLMWVVYTCRPLPLRELNIASDLRSERPLMPSNGAFDLCDIQTVVIWEIFQKSFDRTKPGELSGNSTHILLALNSPADNTLSIYLVNMDLKHL